MVWCRTQPAVSDVLTALPMPVFCWSAPALPPNAREIALTSLDVAISKIDREMTQDDRELALVQFDTISFEQIVDVIQNASCAAA
jgi:hypothetical protein